MQLHTIWFILIVILWLGFFVLDGFDFGVGALHMLIGRTDTERRVVINTIGPWWDGNEVWLIVAGGAMFAAFPGWYATLFSAGYLALVLVLVALFARGVSFEYRGKRDDPRWRAGWSWAQTIGSILVPLLLGVALGDLLNGLPINQNHDFTGDFFDLLTGYGLMTGVTLLTLCLLHGATFLTLRTTGEIRDRARAAGRVIGLVAIVINVAWVIWTLVVMGGGTVPQPTQIFGVIAVIFAALLVNTNYNGWAFASSAFAIAAAIGQIFIALYPNVMVSSTNTAYNLTVNNVVSGHYALVVMTIVAVLFLPIVLLYQGWSFHVFRQRLSAPPASAEAPGGGEQLATQP
ncbi:MAG: cytochrome d ubiquinol oxidase subunit II [Solirubrobacterales bacterium]|nr:cytochrome d ubiquinol oxidase subunit II [Solirubrobacterales bacterium]MBV9796856.1 cytochrome d ubiquinol oxidase subunit II [Solirubrobacterales bacterium]